MCIPSFYWQTLVMTSNLEGFDNLFVGQHMGWGKGILNPSCRKREKRKGELVKTRRSVILGCSRSSRCHFLLFTLVCYSSLILSRLPPGFLTQEGCLWNSRDLKGKRCTFIFATLGWNFSIFFNYESRQNPGIMGCDPASNGKHYFSVLL